MKPNFALNFTDTSIALLHRTARGWLKVGETPFDAADLDEALAKMRQTALGLEPGGFTTKLVLPPSQILYSVVPVSGGTEEDTQREIGAELERRTPYKADEVVFDWHLAGPRSVKVAAVARETLEEAEGFASTHDFNPLGFVGIPEEEQFEGEPWFGVTLAAADLLPEGAEPERDNAPITLLDTANRARSKTRAAKEDEAASEAEAEADAVAEPSAATASSGENSASGVTAPALPVARAAEETVTAPPASSEPAPSRPAAQVQSNAIDDGGAERRPAAAAAITETAPQQAAEEVARPAQAPIADIAPLAAPVSPVAAPPAAAPAVPAAIAPVTRPAAPPAPASVASAPAVSAPAPSPVTPRVETPLSPVTTRVEAPLPSQAEPDEAPFAHIPDSGAFQERSEKADPRSAPPPPRQSPSGLQIHRPAPVQPSADDIPPAPSGPVMAAYGRSRSDERVPPVAASPAAPRIPVAPAAEPRAAAPAKAAAARGLGGLVTAPSIPGTRKARSKPSATPVAPAAGPAREAARSLSNSPFNGPPPKRGSRYMALILTAVLLLCLALVAAWSSFFLASEETRDQSVQLAAPPSGVIDPDEEGEGETLAAEEAVSTDPALTVEETAVAALEAPAPQAQGESPAPVALLDGEDEIFLSSADVPPPAFDALSLPTPEASAEAPPGSPMPPPPFGTVYRFDDNGLLVPTAEGIPAPGGFMLYEGKPPRVPPARSAVATAAAEAAVAARQAEVEAEAAAKAAAAAALNAPAADPATAPAAAGNPSLVTTLPAEEAPTAAGAAPQAQPDPELADRRPRTRPESPVPDDDAALATEATTATAALDVPGLRPRARPESIIKTAASAREATASASLVDPDAVVQLASAAAPSDGISITDAANPSLLTISRRPAAKPDNFSAAVEAAVAAAVRAPEPAPKSSGQVTARPEEEDEIDEPQVAAAPAPKIPTKASVAKQATFTKAINLSKINLIGVYGTQSNRYALVRLANGKFRKVGVGDKIDGGQVRAITQNELRYQKGGRLLALPMPKG